jgi:hypothetical protein
MTSTCFEPEGLSPGRLLYTELHFTCIGIRSKHTFLPTRLLIPMHVKCSCVYSCLPEDKPSSLKHVEDINIKN